MTQLVVNASYSLSISCLLVITLVDRAILHFSHIAFVFIILLHTIVVLLMVLHLFRDSSDHDGAVAPMLHVLSRLLIGIQWARSFLSERSCVIIEERTVQAWSNDTILAGIPLTEGSRLIWLLDPLVAQLHDTMKIFESFLLSVLSLTQLLDQVLFNAF